MKAKNKKLASVMGLALGVAVFAGAALADLPTSNGYDIGKTALKGLTQNENYTMDMSVKLLLDDEVLTGDEMSEKYDRNGDVILNRIEKTSSSDDYEYFSSNTEYRRYNQDGKDINIYKYSSGEESTNIHNNDTYYRNPVGALDSAYNADENEKDTYEKLIRFAELACDTVVGDLKNNIVYVSGDDGFSTYEMNLDAMQIPEVVNAGVALLFSDSFRYDDDNPLKTLGDDTIVKNVALKFTVDSEKRLSDVYIKATISGNGHEAAFEGTMKIYDYGTTVPERIDISTLKNVTTYDEPDSNAEIYEDPEIAAEAATVNEDGEVLDDDGNVIGHIQINEKGEGVIGGADGPTAITITQ